jgi:transposase
MLQITPQQTIFVSIQPVDFRNGIDGLAAICRSILNQDPFSGILFVFTNRPRTAIKILVYDGQGFWLCMKRFSKGKLAWWPKEKEEKCPYHELLASQLQILLYQGSPEGAKIPEDWRKIKPLKLEVIELSEPQFVEFPYKSKEAKPQDS